MTESELADIERRANATTPGPWEFCSEEFVCSLTLSDGAYIECIGSPGCEVLRFAAHARTDVPALLAEVRRLRAEVEEADWLLKRAVSAIQNEGWRRTWDEARDAWLRANVEKP